MIVDPDFCDHWKTRMLVGALGGDEAAPIYVLRLWAHCQNRRQSTFTGLSAEALKALCRFPGNANKLETSLTTSGFVRRVDDDLIVCNWDEYNSSLIAAWKNGKKGGRPKDSARTHRTDNPNETQREPTGKPTGKPTGSREEKRREEKSSNSLSLTREQEKIPDQFRGSERFVEAWERWKAHCLQAQKPITSMAADAQLMELLRCTTSADDAAALLDFSRARGAKNLITSGEHRGKPSRDEHAPRSNGRKRLEEWSIRD